MARVSISWDGCEPIEYDGGQEAMNLLAEHIVWLSRCGLLEIVSKGAGELQYAAELQDDQSHSVSPGHRDQGSQLDIEDAIKEVQDNGC